MIHSQDAFLIDKVNAMKTICYGNGIHATDKKNNTLFELKTHKSIQHKSFDD